MRRNTRDDAGIDYLLVLYAKVQVQIFTYACSGQIFLQSGTCFLCIMMPDYKKIMTSSLLSDEYF